VNREQNLEQNLENRLNHLFRENKISRIFRFIILLAKQHFDYIIRIVHKILVRDLTDMTKSNIRASLEELGCLHVDWFYLT
jgi:hypothetical protein